MAKKKQGNARPRPSRYSETIPQMFTVHGPWATPNPQKGKRN